MTVTARGATTVTSTVIAVAVILLLGSDGASAQSRRPAAQRASDRIAQVMPPPGSAVQPPSANVAPNRLGVPRRSRGLSAGPAGPAGQPPLGATRTLPGAVGRPPAGAVGPPPMGAAGPPPLGAAGPPPLGAAGPPPVNSGVTVPLGPIRCAPGAPCPPRECDPDGTHGGVPCDDTEAVPEEQ